MNLNKKRKMKPELFKMLESACLADIAKAKLTLNLLSEHPAGIGDHSTEDFYNNAEAALSKLAEAQDKLDCLHKNYPEE